MKVTRLRATGLAFAAGTALFAIIPDGARAQFRSYGQSYIGAPMPILPASRGLDEGGPASGGFGAPKRRPVAAPRKPRIKQQAKLAPPAAEGPVAVANPISAPPPAVPAPTPAPIAQPVAAPAPIALASPAYVLPPLTGVPAVLPPPSSKPTQTPTQTKPTLPDAMQKRVDSEPRASQHVVPVVRLVYPPMGDSSAAGQ